MSLNAPEPQKTLDTPEAVKGSPTVAPSLREAAEDYSNTAARLTTETKQDGKEYVDLALAKPAKLASTPQNEGLQQKTAGI